MIGYKRVTTEEELRRKDLFFWSDGHRCSSSRDTRAGCAYGEPLGPTSA
jgi:hypothetical protein